MDSKQKRRQVAGALMTGALMTGLLGGNASGDKGGGATSTSSGNASTANTTTNTSKKKSSSAQPRPQIVVKARGIGPVHELNDNDVLCGRGGRINAHPGNVQFRDLVVSRKKEYLAKSTRKLEKAHIAAEVVQQIRNMNPSGRFLKEDADGSWYDIGDQKAIKKVGQALREDAPEVRQELDTHSDDEMASAVGASPGNNATATRRTAGGDAVTNNFTQSTAPTTATTSASSTTSSNSAGGGAKQRSNPRRNSPFRTQVAPNEQNAANNKNQRAYEPLACETVVSVPPLSYNPHIIPSMPPPQAQFNSNPPLHQFSPTSLMAGILPNAGVAGVSGAAAAAMQQQHDDDEGVDVFTTQENEAFGRPFYEPPCRRVEAVRETSLMSGLSGGPASIMSGLSFTSFTDVDKVSALSGNTDTSLRRKTRNVWPRHGSNHNNNASINVSMAASDMTGTRGLLTASAGLGSSLMRSTSLTDLQRADSLGGSSFMGNSLMGGDLRDSFVTTTSAVSNMQSITGSFVTNGTNNSISQPPTRARQNSGLNRVQFLYGNQRQPSAQYNPQAGVAAPNQNYNYYNPQYQHSGGNQGVHYPHMNDMASVADMSMNSESIISFPGSILSLDVSLSESLNALDLARSNKTSDYQYQQQQYGI